MQFSLQQNGANTSFAKKLGNTVKKVTGNKGSSWPPSSMQSDSKSHRLILSLDWAMPWYIYAHSFILSSVFAELNTIEFSKPNAWWNVPSDSDFSIFLQMFSSWLWGNSIGHEGYGLICIFRRPGGSGGLNLICEMHQAWNRLR